MNHSSTRIIAVALGVAIAFIFYIAPDMFVMLGETGSMTFKAVCALVFIVLGALLRKKHNVFQSTAAISAGVVLFGLIAFGGYIRGAELGMW
jgi:hypothetical protein